MAWGSIAHGKLAEAVESMTDAELAAAFDQDVDSYRPYLDLANK